MLGICQLPTQTGKRHWCMMGNILYEWMAILDLYMGVCPYSSVVKRIYCIKRCVLDCTCTAVERNCINNIIMS